MAKKMMRVVIMGPSGSGKSVIGEAVCSKLNLDFIDADDLHPANNVAKMSEGIPLTDEDRIPWLNKVGQELTQHECAMVACSALARQYRDILRNWVPDVVFVELMVSRDELVRRMESRRHFMPVGLLDSQVATLQHLDEDELGFQIQNSGDPQVVVNSIVTRLEA